METSLHILDIVKNAAINMKYRNLWYSVFISFRSSNAESYGSSIFNI